MRAIHAIDRVDGICFLVLELVPGESLDDRIARGPLPVAHAIPIARQVARGLQAAHEAGIVHRDIKPANVVVTPAGVAKVLDFGLARRGPDPREAESLAVLGTPAYLSPEQVRGEETNRRADIWSPSAPCGR